MPIAAELGTAIGGGTNPRLGHDGASPYGGKPGLSTHPKLLQRPRNNRMRHLCGTRGVVAANKVVAHMRRAQTHFEDHYKIKEHI